MTELNTVIDRGLQDIVAAIKDIDLSNYARKTGTIEIVGELDGLPAELVGEYTVQ